MVCLFLIALIRRHEWQAADADAAAAVLAGAGVHGFVEKAGPLDPQQWQVGSKEWRQNRTQEWDARRRAELAAGEGEGALRLTCTRRLCLPGCSL